MTLYLDTSALVKLYVDETGSADVRAQVHAARVVATSVVAYAETRAALARLRRERLLPPQQLATLRRQFDEQWEQYLALEATDSLCRAAGDLGERYGLRGFDSIHLASFQEVARRGGLTQTRFSSFDDTLNRAARKLLRALRRP
jgi:uncharacterized protein